MSSDLYQDPTSSPRFWMAIDGRIERGLQRIAKPVRGIYNSAKGSVPALAAQVRARLGEVVSDLEVAQVFGLASVPPAETEVIIVHVGGDPGHPVAVADIDRSHRPTDLEAGESQLYSSARARVTCKADGSVLIEAGLGGASVEVTPTGTLKLNGGGAAVARVGDAVTASGTDSNGDTVTVYGTITAGSSSVQAGG